MDTVLDELTFGDDFRGVRDRLIVELFYLTGIRRAELVGLADRDVDLDGLKLTVMGKRAKERVVPFGPDWPSTSAATASCATLGLPTAAGATACSSTCTGGTSARPPSTGSSRRCCRT
jgi:site-specific recombinase XerC